MLEEDSFLGTCPFDVVLEDTDLGFGRVRDGKEEIEKGTNLSIEISIEHKYNNRSAH